VDATWGGCRKANTLGALLQTSCSEKNKAGSKITVKGPEVLGERWGGRFTVRGRNGPPMVLMGNGNKIRRGRCGSRGGKISAAARFDLDFFFNFLGRPLRPKVAGNKGSKKSPAFFGPIGGGPRGEGGARDDGDWGPGDSHPKFGKNRYKRAPAPRRFRELSEEMETRSHIVGRKPAVKKLLPQAKLSKLAKDKVTSISEKRRLRRMWGGSRGGGGTKKNPTP